MQYNLCIECGQLLENNEEEVHEKCSNKLIIMNNEQEERILKEAQDIIEDEDSLNDFENEEDLDLGLESCEQCGENAWDGYICHNCGLKEI